MGVGRLPTESAVLSEQPTSSHRVVNQKGSPVAQLHRAHIIWKAHGAANISNSSILGFQQARP